MKNKTFSLILLFTLFASVLSINAVVNNHSGEVSFNSSGLKMNEITSNVINKADTDFSANKKVDALQSERVVNEAFSTEMTTNKSEYNPGDGVHLHLDSSLNGLNGTTSWLLKTPLDENVTGFSNDASRVFFDDPNLLNQGSLEDWQNLSFSSATSVYSVSAGTNLMNLTTADASSTASLIYNKYTDIEGKFVISIAYTTVSTDHNANLTFSYWNGTQFLSKELVNTTNGVYNTVQFSAILNSKNMPGSLFNFTLDHSQAVWSIKPIQIHYELDPVDLT